jgi:hypothetical protein
MILDRQQILSVQEDGIDWNGKPLVKDADYGPRTRWWHGISTLPCQRQLIVRTFLKYNGRKEDTGKPNRSEWLDEIQKPGGLGVGNPWCIAFISHVMRECSVDWPLYHMSAWAMIEWAKQNGRITENPLPGDLFAFLYNPEAIGFTPGHGGGILATNADWVCDADGNVGDSVCVGKRARQGLTFIRTVDSEDPPLTMPPLKDLTFLDGARTR